MYGMSKLPFDDALRRRLDNFDSAVPDAVWSAVERQLPKSRRRGVWGWYPLAIILLLGLGAAWWQPWGPSVQAPVDEPAKNQDTEPSAGAFPIAHTTESLADGPLGAHAQTGAHDQPPAPGIAHPKMTAPFITENHAVMPARYPSKSLAKTELLPAPAMEHLPSSSWPYRDGLSTIPVAGATYPVLPRFSAMQRPWYEAGQVPNAGLRGPFEPEVLPDKPSPIGCPPVHGRMGQGAGWFLEPYVGIFAPFSSTTYNAGALPNNDTVSSRLAPLPSLQAGLMAGTYLAPGRSLKAGFQYSMWHEQFQYTNQSERQITTTITTRLVILNTGDSLRVQDTTITERIGRRTVRSNNRYQSVELPVILGFEWGNHTRWSANIGAIAGLRSVYRGTMADTLNKPVAIQEEWYRRSMGVALYGGLGIMQPVGNRLQVLAEPFVRVNLANEAAAQSWFRQRRVAAGINAGLRFNIQ